MATIKKQKTELIITRIFDVPRAVVWKAWTDPELFKRWWGPKNFTTTVSKIDLRKGGSYLANMRSPEGQEFWSTGVYREIVPMERIVCTDSFADEKGKVVPASHYGMPGEWPLELLITLKFEDIGGKTKMTLHHEGAPRARCTKTPQSDGASLSTSSWNSSYPWIAPGCLRNRENRRSS